MGSIVSNSQVIGCEDRLRNDLYCVGWGVKLYSIQFYGPMLTLRDSRHVDRIMSFGRLKFFRGQTWAF